MAADTSDGPTGVGVGASPAGCSATTLAGARAVSDCFVGGMNVWDPSPALVLAATSVGMVPAGGGTTMSVDDRRVAPSSIIASIPAAPGRLVTAACFASSATDTPPCGRWLLSPAAASTVTPALACELPGAIATGLISALAAAALRRESPTSSVSWRRTPASPAVMVVDTPWALPLVWSTRDRSTRDRAPDAPVRVRAIVLMRGFLPGDMSGLPKPAADATCCWVAVGTCSSLRFTAAWTTAAGSLNCGTAASR